MGDLSLLDSKGLIGEFYAHLENSPVGWVDQLAFHVDSNTEVENYAWLGQSPKMKEWIGGRKATNLKGFTYSLTNKLFEAGLDINIDDFRRDKTSQILTRIKDLASRTQTHWATLLSALIIAGTANDCYDGFKFFAANHSEGDSGTQKNLLTASEIATLNVGTPAAPTAAEFSMLALDIIGHMMSYKDNTGEPMNDTAMNWAVMVPTNMMSAGTTAINQNNLQGTSGVVQNVLKNDAFNISLIVNPRLTATDAIYMIRTDASAKPFIKQSELGVQLDVLGTDSEYAKLNRKAFFGVSASRNVGYGYWQYAAKATLS